MPSRRSRDGIDDMKSSLRFRLSHKYVTPVYGFTSPLLLDRPYYQIQN
jgi:hypothetical protein